MKKHNYFSFIEPFFLLALIAVVFIAACNTENSQQQESIEQDTVAGAAVEPISIKHPEWTYNKNI